MLGDTVVMVGSSIPRGGGSLAGAYYAELVGPLLEARWPDLPHAAGRLGSGSDVLGLDDEMSRDHDWGLRMTVLVDEELVAPVRAHLECEMPESYVGQPTRLSPSGRDAPSLGVDVDSPGGFVSARLGHDPREGMTSTDWLSMTGQSVLEVTGGPVFHDSTGEITRIRARHALVSPGPVALHRGL
jgi:hypothetical protein